MFGKTKKGKNGKLKLPDEGIKKFKKSKLDNLKEINKITSEHNYYGEELSGEDEIVYQEESVDFDKVEDTKSFTKNESKLKESDLVKTNKQLDQSTTVSDAYYLDDQVESNFDSSKEVEIDENSSYENLEEQIDFIEYEDIESGIESDIETDTDEVDLYDLSEMEDSLDDLNEKMLGLEVKSDAKARNKIKLGKISFKLFDNLMIKTRILLGFMSILLLISIVGIMVFSTIGSMIKSQIPIILHTENFKNKVFEMERVEKNFLLFEPSNMEFYKTGESEYVEEFKIGYDEALKSFEIVIESPIIKSSDNIEEIEAFRVMLEEYSSEFINVTEMIAVRGYGEYGKMGELKEASEALKKAVIASNSKELEAGLYKVFLLESEYF
ncbi:MAG: hypothetical protein WBA54_02295, partial [Acidaminobacteraceae bacterium]